jgi:hypothetical protein
MHKEAQVVGEKEEATRSSAALVGFGLRLKSTRPSLFVFAL